MEWKDADALAEEGKYTEEDLFGEKPYSSWSRDKLNLDWLKNRPVILALAGAGVVLLVIMAVLLLVPNTRKAEDSARFAALEAKFNRLEDRFTKLEEIDERLQEIVGLQNELELLADRMAQIELSVGSRMDEIASNLKDIQKETVATRAPSSPQVLPQKSVKAATKKSGTRYYQVQAGDTLYRISRRYGLSVDKLRRLNNLDANAVIRPGQRLNVGASAKP